MGATIEYLRLSVTDRCDLRCGYCIPKGFRDFEIPEHWLDFDEIERLVRAFTALGLNRHAYEQITGLDVLNSVLDGLESARNLGFGPIKINMVVMQGINDHDIDSLLTYCIEHGFTLRLIETMPMGSAGRNAQYLSLRGICRRNSTWLRTS